VPFGVFLSVCRFVHNVVSDESVYGSSVDTFTVGFKDYKHLNELEHAI